MDNDFYLSDSISNQRRFFGRRKAKSLSPLQSELYTKAQTDLFFDIQNDFDFKSLFEYQHSKIILEIGFGGGEHLLHQAQCNPDVNYIGIDAYVNGVSKLVRSVYANNIKNIRLSDADAFYLLNVLPENSLDGIYLLYPDPWPKTRHRNRRFIQRDTAVLIEKIIKPYGFFRFASDIPDYVEWVFAALTNATSAYIDIDKKSSVPFENWIPTRYEQKAKREGRESEYYQFFFQKNIKNLAIDLK
jgi:tRNA (guanine-N7-)-methyltransferase